MRIRKNRSPISRASSADKALIAKDNDDAAGLGMHSDAAMQLERRIELHASQQTEDKRC